MAKGSRLEFALRSIRSADWEAFERFAGVFHADEFPGLRSVAGVGDKGRDAILQEPDGSGVIMQWSIAEDWRGKILQTLKRLEEAGINCTVLIYATNREIGTRADDLKTAVRKRGVSLDVRDRMYFVGRVNRSDATRGAAEELAERIVDPLLPAQALVRNDQLGGAELRAGLLYLELQLYDADQQRGLTKLAFDALVRASLAETTPEKMKPRAQIVQELAALFPSHDEQRLATIVDGSLERLRNQQSVVYKGREDSFALHHAERTALDERIDRLLEEQRAVDQEIVHRIAKARESLEIMTHVEDSEELLDAVRATVEALLDRQGNEFAAAVTQDDGAQLGRSDVYELAKPVVTRRSQALQSTGLETNDLAELVTETVVEVVAAPDRVLQRYLREYADAYTLLALLRATPDVQRAVKHLFGRGALILDTTVILPVFAESILDVSEQRFSNLMRAAKRVGINLMVTEGVLEEIATHLARSVAYSRTDPSEWNGEVPFVYRHWLETATTGVGGAFPAFVDRFRGRSQPLDDLADFLKHEFGVETVDLAEVADSFPVEVRGRATEIWRERRRKQRRAYRPESEIDLLVRHDVEMFFGTLARRSNEARGGIYGHENWWVTLDGTALRIATLLAEEGQDLPSNPCMSPNFLSNLIAIGPGRATLDPSLRERLPVALDIQQFGWGVAELATIADKIRLEHEGQPEYFIRRKTREAMERIKTRRGEVDAPFGEDGDLPTVTG